MSLTVSMFCGRNSGVQQKQESTFLNQRIFIPKISNLHSVLLLGESYTTSRKPSTLFLCSLLFRFKEIVSQ